MSYLGNTCSSNRIGDLSSTKEQLNLKQNLIKLNFDEVGRGVDEKIAGLIVERGQYPDALLRFNEDPNYPRWEIGLDGNLRPVNEIHKVISSSSALEEYTVNHVDTRERSLVLLLPDNPRVGATIAILDLYGTFDINPVTINTSRTKILSNNTSMLLNVKYGNVVFTYISNDIGWAISPHTPIEMSNLNINFPVSVFNQYITSFDFNNLTESQVVNLNNILFKRGFSVLSTSGQTIELNKTYLVKSKNISNFTIYFPHFASNFDFVRLIDFEESFEEFNVTLILTNLNHKFHRNYSDLTLDHNGLSVMFLFYNNIWIPVF